MDAIVELYNRLIHPRRYIADVEFTREFLKNDTPDLHELRSDHFLELFGSLYQLSTGLEAQFYQIVNFYDRFRRQHPNIYRQLSAYIFFHRNIRI